MKKVWDWEKMRKRRRARRWRRRRRGRRRSWKGVQSLRG